MTTNLKSHFEEIKEHLEAASKAYQRFTEILSFPAVIADRDADKPKAAHLLKIIEEAYHAHLPVEILKLILIINLPGAGSLETCSTNLWAGNKHYQGLDVAPALKSLTDDGYVWEMALNTKIGDEPLNRVVADIRYYRNKIEKILGEIITFFHIA